MRKFLLMLFCLLCLASYAQVIENPVFDRTDAMEYRVEKVECTEDTTYLYCSLIADAGLWANISKETYLRDVNSNIKYPLLKCIGLPYSPEKRYFVFDERCYIKMCFDPIQDVTKFDLIENPNDKAFNIYGIDLNNQYKETYIFAEQQRFSNMSSFYESSGDTIKAIQFKKKEAECTKFIHGIKSEAYLVSLQGLALMYDKYNYHGEAIENMETVTELHADIWGTSDKYYASAIRTLAQLYSHAGIFDKSIETFKKSILQYDSLNICDKEYAIALRFISDAYELSGDEYHAIEYQKKAIEVRKKLNNSDDYLEELEILTIQGDSLARTNIVESELIHLPVFVDTTSIHFSIVLKALTSSLISAGDYMNAMKYCDRNLSLLYKFNNDNKIEIAEALGYKCRLYRRQDLYHDAIEIGKKAKLIFDSINAHPQIYCFILDDIAWCYGALFDYENSILYQKLLATIYEANREWISLAETLGTLGEHYQHKEDLAEAEKNIKKAIKVLSEHNAEEIICEYIKSGIVDISNSSKDLKIITSHYNIVKCSLLNSLAIVCLKSGKCLEAIQAQKESNINSIKMGEKEMYSSGLTQLSLLYHFNNQYKESIMVAEESIKLTTQLDYKEKNANLSFSYLQIAINYYKMCDQQQAINNLMKSISLTDGISGLDSYTLPRLILSILYFEYKEYSKAELYLSEALDFLQSEITNEITQMKSGQKQRLWDRFKHYFVRYRDVIEKEVFNGQLNSKLYNYTLFSKSLMQDTDCARDEEAYNRLIVNWKDIQKKLSNQDIAIEFITTTEDSIYQTYHALVIDNTCEYPQMITLYHESDLMMIRKESKEYIINILGNLIWRPILDQYPQIRNIYFSPDGIIHVYPIEYYHVDGIGEMAGHYNLYRLSSTKEIVFQHKGEKANKATLYGGLDYDLLAKESSIVSDGNMHSLLRSINDRGGFEPLLSTLEEVNEIRSILNSKAISTNLYVGQEGTEDSFNKLSGKHINILHLSTHGMYVGPDNVTKRKIEDNFNFLQLITNEKDPVKEDIVLTHSFLVMSGGNKINRRETIESGSNDGILTAYEISKVDLNNVDLVVLSACETGLGDIEYSGVYGLQRGFKKAGANTILMSLDKVDDEATKILMVEFYRNLMNGESKLQSIKHAQKHLRQVDNGKYDEPKYWASFIMLDGLN